MKSAFPPLINPSSTVLILGTMPGEQSLLRQEYYGNRGNHFWKLLFTVFKKPFSDDYETRKALLTDHNIALWDVLAFCERDGSLDSRIKNEIPNDFELFYKQHPNIRQVFFSSLAAEKYYDKYAARKPEIAYRVLPSPSGANATKTFVQKLDAWNILKDYF